MAADVEEELALPVRLGDRLDLLVGPAEHLVDAVRQALDLADQLGEALGRELAAQLGQAQRRAGT